jgi:PhzF family phenazine biosynthesis protein
VLLTHFPSRVWMQALANELNQAETAFAVRQGQNEFHLRWFTPRDEVALCGHATLAMAHYLWEIGESDRSGALTFYTLSGSLVASEHHGDVELELPIVPSTRMDPTTAVQQALGVQEIMWAGTTSNAVESERNLVLELRDERELAAVTPDLVALRRLPVGGVIVTARGEEDVVLSRYFAPRFGIDEDSVTGSAHCTLAPLWAPRLGRVMRARQLSPRGGELRMELTDTSVKLRGATRTVITAHLVGAADLS